MMNKYFEIEKKKTSPSHKVVGIDIICSKNVKTIIELNGEVYDIDINSIIIIDSSKSYKVISGDDNNQHITIDDLSIFKNTNIHILLNLIRFRNIIQLSFSWEQINTLYSIINGITLYSHQCENEHIKNIMESLLSEFSTIIFKQLKVSSSIRDNVKWESLFSFYNLLEKEYSKTRSVSYYCKKINVSQKKLNDFCEEIVSKKAKEIIDLRVIHQIDYLLENSKSSIVDISYELGFFETTNLVKFYKRYRNITPAKYRKRYLNFLKV